MRPKPLSVSSLLEFIPEDYFEAIAKQTNVDYQVKKLNGRLMFNLLLMGILHSERLSLRVLEKLYTSQKFRTFASLPKGSTTRHSSLSDRIESIKSSYFEELFYKISLLLNNKFKGKDKSKYSVERFDSTMVSLSSKLMNFGMQNGLKNNEGEHSINQLKFSIGFNGLLPRTVRLYTEQKQLSENESLYWTILEHEFEKDSIVVFDRGINNREKFKELNKSNKLFVTRLNPTNNYKILEKLNKKVLQSDTLIIEQDLKVYLIGGKGAQVKTPLRLIIARTKEKKDPIYFISNIFDLSCEEIAQVYKMRWDIEVFFRFLKQELNFKHLISRSQNGIMVMVYMTLITAMLLLVHKEVNKIQGYKIAKIQFTNELDDILLKEIIIACKGDPALL
jgi:hypothetical protein